MGGAAAIAVFGALIAGPAGFVYGMQASFTIAAALLFLTTLASLRMRSQAASSQTPAETSR